MNPYAPDLSSAVTLSLQVGFTCVLLGLPVALPLGWILARRSFVGKSLLATVCIAPVVLPPVVTGYLLLYFLGADSLIGGWLATMGLQVPFTFAGAAIAALIVGLPFYIVGARAAFENVDPRYEQVAQTLGKTPLQIFARVTLPLAWPGIAAGAMLTFARAFGEFGATVVLAGNIEGQTRTIALAIYTLLESPSGLELIGKLVVVSMVIALVTLVVYEFLMRWQKRRLEA